jgi:RNA polymerase sigma-70 factor (ECF subfamily)
VRQAVLELPQPDREIFLRYYYYLQTSSQIAEAMGMEDSTVRGRLMRGRNHLKQMLLKEGIV